MVGIVSDIGMVRNLNEDYAKYLECNDFKIYVVYLKSHDNVDNVVHNDQQHLLKQ